VISAAEASATASGAAPEPEPEAPAAEPEPEAAAEAPAAEAPAAEPEPEPEVVNTAREIDIWLSNLAIAAKAAIHALQGEVLPQYVSVPIPLTEDPDFKAGVNYYPDLSDNFFTPNEFKPCDVNVTATEIMGKSEANN